MVRSLWTGASGMIAQQQNVDTIANNLANVSTRGYKTEKAEFKSLLYQTLQTRSTNNAGEEKPISAQVGLGTRTASITSQFTQGNLIDDDSPFAIGIEGEGFFKVRTNTGATQYTRDGNFAISQVAGGNLLCTGDGEPILDINNERIVIPFREDNNDPNSPIYNPSDIYIDKDGRMSISINGGQSRDLGMQIGMVQFANPAGLEKVSSNKYIETVASGAPMEEATNVGLTKSRMHQYYLEASNVQVSQEMVNLIVAQRAYEMNSKIIQASDTMLEQANNLRR